MSNEGRLIHLNRAARAVVAIEAWYRVAESRGIWEALIEEARAELHPMPGTPVSTALSAALATMIADIEAAETTPSASEGVLK